jgi:hypothetical protein
LDILTGLSQVIDAFWYNILLSVAGLHWSLLRGLIMMGHTVEVINNWLLNNAFAPLIAQTNASLSTAVRFAFVLALLVLGLTYLLAAFIRLDVVNFRSAILWYIAGALFFSFGPDLYRGMNDFRSAVAQGFYASTLSGLQATTGTTFSALDRVESNDLALGPLCDYLDVYLPDATGPGDIDGLDVAVAFLRADGPDVMGYDQPMYSPGCPAHFYHPATGAYISGVPQEWFSPGSYFDFQQSPYFFETMDDEQRAASISMASAAHSRMFAAWPLVLFGVAEQIVYLLITIAMGLTFISFSMAILFAFFKKTEAIARSIVDQWIELIVQTVVIAMIQSLVVAFFLAGTASGNSMVTLGIGLICLIFMVIVLWSGVKAVWNSLNRLFNALGQATGGAVVSPGAATAAAAAVGAVAAGGAVAIGSNALAGMTALNRGATTAQTAGVMLGGSSSLGSAARMLAYLPGVRGTSLGDAAEQFTEGAITRQVARNVPVVGRAAGPLTAPYLLTNRDPDAADYDDYGRVLSRPMLVPAVGEGLERFTVPAGSSGKRPAAGGPEFIEGEEGEFLPVDDGPRRMGTFTPVAVQSEQSTAAAETQGEEMEQHISDTMRSSLGVTSPLNAVLSEDQQQDDHRLNHMAARLEASADALLQAAQLQMMVGRLRVSGSQDVAGVMGDVVSGARRTNAPPMIRRSLPDWIICKRRSRWRR